MNNIAKIFIVINFILSIIYLAFAATLLAQKWDYRQMYLQQETRYENEKKELEIAKQNAEKRIASFEQRFGEAKKLADKYKDDLASLQINYDELKRTNESYSSSLKKISIDIQDINENKLAKKDERISQLETEKERLKETAEEAKKAKEEAIDELQRIELILNEKEGELAEKKKLLARAEKELWEAKQIIRVVRDSGVNIPRLVTPSKPLDGQIVAVSANVPLVMISLGSDEGVQKGHQFTVYRQNQYIGRVVVEEVYKDMSAARILKDMTSKAIKQGDNVTTRLGSNGGSF
jgi:hypothetical protein